MLPAERLKSRRYLCVFGELALRRWYYHRDGAPGILPLDEDVNLPVEQVSWDDAQEFCRRLTEADRKAGKLPAGVAYRLPTEAEWEYACRSGSTTKYCFGDDEGRLGDYAWYNGNSGRKTHDVGKKKPNAWGLHDMHGNVWEWCQDWLGDYPAAAQTDPSGPPTGRYRVLRGGSWDAPAVGCRSASRFYHTPDDRDNVSGFRVAKPLP